MQKTTFLRSRMALLLPLLLLGGCSLQNVPLLDPKGPIGLHERSLIVGAFLVMLIPVIPVFFMTFWFAWRYRASRRDAPYAPKWAHSALIESVVWLVPTLIIIALGALTWSSTHALSPYRPIASAEKPIRIDAIATDWKWLFIYPDQHIATVNQLVFPNRVPVEFRITSDTVMTSFFIPRLGSQIYAMAGMQTALHLMANEPGSYHGLNAQFSGRGFAEMNFKAIATSKQGFATWLREVRNSPNRLDLAAFKRLEKPTVAEPVTWFSSVQPHLFRYVIDKFRRGETTVAFVQSGKSSG